VDDQPAGQQDDREEVGRLRAALREYDPTEAAEIRARVLPACVTARPEDAEEQALAITLDVLRFRHRGLNDSHVHGHLFAPQYRARRADDDA
jgi:hypothetical protein